MGDKKEAFGFSSDGAIKQFQLSSILRSTWRQVILIAEDGTDTYNRADVLNGARPYLYESRSNK